jgi:hypothetical protein
MHCALLRDQLVIGTYKKDNFTLAGQFPAGSELFNFATCTLAPIVKVSFRGCIRLHTVTGASIQYTEQIQIQYTEQLVKSILGVGTRLFNETYVRKCAIPKTSSIHVGSECAFNVFNAFYR